MKIEVWSDIACPWCFIGKHRLAAALSNFAHAEEVEVVWRSYQLDPGAPCVSEMNLSQILSEKHGLPQAQAVAMAASCRTEGTCHRPTLVRALLTNLTLLASPSPCCGANGARITSSGVQVRFGSETVIASPERQRSK